MEGAKIFFNSNIKLLRQRRKMSQDQLAQLLSFTRSKYTALENGQTSNPALVDLVAIATYFNLSLDILLKEDLRKWRELDLRKLETGVKEYVNGKNMRVLSITVDSSNQENLEYVPVKAKAGYAAGYADPEFLKTLPKFTLPNLPRDVTYRMFPTTGDSMLPIPEGSDVIAKYVQDWMGIKPDTLCIVILKGEQDVVFKQVRVLEEGLLLQSFNPNYEPYIVHFSEVVEVWQYVKHQTDTMPAQETDLQEIKRMLMEMKQQLKVDLNA